MTGGIRDKERGAAEESRRGVGPHTLEFFFGFFTRENECVRFLFVQAAFSSCAQGQRRKGSRSGARSQLGGEEREKWYSLTCLRQGVSAMRREGEK